MANEADVAQDYQEADLQHSLARHQVEAEKLHRPEPTGYCLNQLCCDDLDGGRLFCGPECAKEYGRLNRR